jgi:hypothetical protein
MEAGRSRDRFAQDSSARVIVRPARPEKPCVCDAGSDSPLICRNDAQNHGFQLQ